MVINRVFVYWEDLFDFEWIYPRLIASREVVIGLVLNYGRLSWRLISNDVSLTTLQSKISLTTILVDDISLETLRSYDVVHNFLGILQWNYNSES